MLVQIFKYLKTYKKLWLGPLIVALLLLGGFIVLVKVAALSPLIYTVF